MGSMTAGEHGDLLEKGVLGGMVVGSGLGRGVGWAAAGKEKDHGSGRDRPGRLRLDRAEGRFRFSAGLESPDAGHVVGEGEPEGNGFGLDRAADGELAEAAVARLGVGAFGGGCPLLVDGAGRVGAHARAPGRDPRWITGSWHMAVALRVAWPGHRSKNLAALLLDRSMQASLV